MEESFLKAVELCPEIDPEPYFQLGWLYYDRKNWTEAEKFLKQFLDFDKINEEHGKRAELMLTRSTLYAKPVPFSPVVVKSLSTADP